MAHNPMGKDPADYESQPIFNATTQKYNMINTRTGLFEACINMPTVTGNSGCGPVFDPSLFYSPTTNNLNAIGDGWEFCFTLFSEAYKVLTLHTGETLKLEKGKNLKQPAVIVEWGNDDTLTVYRKGGRTEVLFKLGDTSFYVPQSLTTDGYNYLYFSWIATPHIIDGKTYYQIKLQTVKDKLRTLINIDYTLAEEGAQPAKTPATLTYWPDDSVETLRYVLTIEDYALKSVKLADGIETKLEYLDHKTAGWLLITYTSPDNQVEEIEYSDNGLYFPDNPQLSALPCAVDHHLRPNGGGEMVPTFLKYEKESNHKTYTTTKFSLDRIIAYKYDAITNEILSETVTRTYEGKPAITTTKYTLSAEPNAIKNEQSVTYSKDGKSRTANMHTRFDKDAALISNTQSGKTTSYQYYDEGKFLSNKLISETLSRSALLNFPIHEKKYLYTSISDMSETPLFHVQENYYSVSIPLSKTTFQTYDYFEDNDFRKGKPKSINLGGDLYKAITRNFEYTLGGVNGTELTTIETLVDETEELKPERKSSTTQSTLSGRLIRQVDTDGNHAEYTYDAFGRLASLTLCAQSPTYKQTTTYAYPAPGQVKSTEPNGRVRLSEYDGQDRLVREYEYTTATTKRLLKEISYNDKGQELRTTEYDYVADGTAISEWSQNVYDAWGEIGGQLHSDGRQTFKLYDPVALTLTEWAGKATDKHRKVTTYKPDETIEKIEFLDQAGAIFQTQNATYTLNNQVQQLRTHNEFGVNTVDYTYDHYGRVLTEAHVEDDKGLLPLLNLAYTYHYTYQPFSPSDEPATLEISFGIGLQKHRLGTREFDNWERVTSLVRGTLEETYTYDGTSPAPATKKTADGTILEYEYIKELGNKPSKVSKAQSSLQKTFSYAYAGQSASRAVEGESVLENSHNRDLLVTRQQVQTKDGQSKAVSYSYSPAGRLLRETDVFGTSTEFLYSPGGQRIRSTNQFFTRHEYDDQGQLKQEVVETRSGATQRVEVTYTYDAQQREISRRFVPMENTPVGVEIATTYYADGKFKQVQLKRGSTVLGSRNFTYTAGGRLKSCETAGVWRPKNPKGALIDKQQFTYDGMGNVLTCVSTFAGAHNTATYTYNNSMSFRLEGIKNTHADYTKSATMTYDTAGRVSQDLNGRKYTYDGLGRLVQAGSTRYRYDPDDRLMTRNEGADERQVIYNDLKASGEYATENNASYRHLSPGSAACYAQRTKMSGAQRIIYQWCDQNGTPLVSFDAVADTTKFHAYDPYGGQFPGDSDSLLGNNGELYDNTTGQSPMGCGYRYLTPEAHQFHAPDSESPFGNGGPHAYGYCTDNDPINFHDPSGHFSVSERLRKIWGDNLPQPLSLGKHGSLISTIIFTGIGILTAILTGGTSLLFHSIVIILAVASSITAITSVLIADIAPELSKGLAWASLFYGVLSGGLSLGYKIAQRAAVFMRYLGNTARSIGKIVVQKTAAITPAPTMVRGLDRLSDNFSAQAFLRRVEPFPIYGKPLAVLEKFEVLGDTNTVLFAITGIISNLGTLEDWKRADGVNTVLGNGSWLPNGSWTKLLKMAR